MAKVFYDHQKFSTQLYGGISRYFANLLEGINRHPNFEYLLGVLHAENHYIQDRLSGNEIIKRVLKSPSHAYFLNKLYCQYLLKKNNYDIFHPTYYDTYFLKSLGKPLVITVHDMTYERLPEYFWAQDPLTHLKRLNIEKADRIIAISETTKNDIIRYLGVNDNKIDVVYHGLQTGVPPSTTAVSNLPSNYLLFVGDRGGYKNFYLLLEAFRQFSLRYPEIKLVLSGGGRLAIAEIEYLKMLGLTNLVIHTDASDSELNFLYQNALAFVYPSLNEGFGLPILEAFLNNCPIILSNTECFREIAQNAAVYFDPRSKEDLITNLENIITNEPLRKQLIANGTTRLRDFPLETTIKKTLNIYQELS